MKKIISIILAVIMVISMTACTNNKSSVSLEEVKQMAEKEIPAINVILGDNWDENNLPQYHFMMIATAKSLYHRDTGEKMPTVNTVKDLYGSNEGIEINILIPVITKYFTFSEELLRNSFIENDIAYDEQTEAVILSDGWGWYLGAVMHDVTDNDDGTYDISYGMYTTEDILEYTGVVKAKVHSDGYLQFISNIIDDK